jgi:rare lipoprotein A
VKHRRAAVFLAVIVTASCGKQMQVALPPPTPARVGAVETGVASWYGKPYHGRTTSNGEVYNMNAMTAAHLSLPFDTIVRVTNLTNSRSVDVRINDRGPFLKQRVIDVSRAAGERLGMIGTGTATVRVEVIAAPGTPPPRSPETTRIVAASATSPAVSTCDSSTIGVQIGSFRDLSNAERALAEISARYASARILDADTPAGPVHRVVVGAPDLSSAQRMLQQLEEEGVDGFVMRWRGATSCFAVDAS